MSTKLFLRMAGVVLALGLSTAAGEAGAGHPGTGRPGGMMMMRPPAGPMHGFGHAARMTGPWGQAPMRFGPGMAGRSAGRGMLYGHTGTSLPSGFSRRFAYGEGRFRYGHVNTGSNRLRPMMRDALQRGGVFNPVYGSGGYDGGYGPGPDFAGWSGAGMAAGSGQDGPYGSTQTGGGAANAAYGYAEPPLNAIGGPQILVVSGERMGRTGHCSCRGEGPMVYRYGVGSYY